MTKKNAKLRISFDGCPEIPGQEEILQGKIREIQQGLRSGQEDFTGWAMLPETTGRNQLREIQDAAESIRSRCDVLAVIGIGGSYLGARAALDFLRKSGVAGNRSGRRDPVIRSDPVRQETYPEVVFAGQNISGSYHADLIDQIRGREVCLCVISKSGTTTEPNIAFSILKDLLIEQYGKKEAAGRIYAVTDAKSGTLRAEAEKEGYRTFEIPQDIGGRYSVLTPVGLLPMAAAGIDIEAVLAGARRAMEEDFTDLSGQYALARKSLLDNGKKIEVIEYYEPALFSFAEWMKQLYGESEGKDGTGLFPAALSFTADLHSMGQFLQEGNQIFFETVLNVQHPDRDLTVPDSADPLLAGKRMNAVNQAAVDGVTAAHRAAGIPMIRIDLWDLSPDTFGQMVYFFEQTCAFTGRLMEVNPFNQPGVEQYKREMQRLLKEG